MSREKEPVVGIDLGTTYSCVGVWQHGQVEIVVNDQGNRTTPSCVAFTNSDRFIGEAALNQAPKNPTNTIFDAKRLIGRLYTEGSVQSDAKLWPFKVIAGADDKPTIVVKYRNEEKHFSAEEISSMVLHKMKETAENYLNHAVKKAVVTVPAYFTDFQRQATKDAATIAGLNLLQIINEPTAAALAYCQQNRDIDRTGKTIALIFDLGGGTLDVSLVEIDGSGGVRVIATDGDTHLGGQDFDNRMVHHALSEISKNHHEDLRLNARAIRRLRTACEKAKRVLSSVPSVDINVDALFSGKDFEMKLTRAKFEDINKDLFERCLEPVAQCLECAKMKKSDIHDVVLVGGSTRIPRIQRMLKDFFGIDDLYTRVNADEAVAIGATILAAKLNGDVDNRIKDAVLIDVTPLSLGVNVKGDTTDVVIPRNTPIPCEKTHMYTTPEDYMSTVRIQVCEGERLDTKENNILGEICLSDIRMARRGEIKIQVSFKIDKSGILNVSAKDMDSKHRVQITVTNVGRLSKDVIDRMVKDAEKYKMEDARRRKEIAARNKLESYLSWIKDAIDKYRVWSIIKDNSSRRSLEDTFEKVTEWTESNQHAPVYELQNMMNDLRMLWEPMRSKLIDKGVVIPDFEE